MALINRMSRLFTADVHAVLDRIEEPVVLLRQAIREMEEEVAAAGQRAARLERECSALADRERKVEASLVEITRQLDVCFEAGNDELARRLVRRKLETQRLREHVAERRTASASALTVRRKKLDEQREHLDVMRQKAELLSDGAGEERAGDDWTRPELAVGDDEVEVAYLQERQRRAGHE